jgi:hypothetical protein
MWDEGKQQELDRLQDRADEGSLTTDEQHRLDELVHELEHEEWTRLRPALDAERAEQLRIQSEVAKTRAENAVLAALAERYADLVARAKLQAAMLTAERDALQAEYERVTK